MAYKVLGQVNSTGPSTSETIWNGILDPSFDNINQAGVSSLTANLTNLVKNLPGTTNWLVNCETNGGSAGLSVGTSMGITPAFGKECIVFRTPGSVTISPGLWYGFKDNTTNSNYQNNQQLDFATAIPVKPNTTYYYGYNALKTQANTHWQARMMILAWSSQGVYQGAYLTDYASPSTENVWQSFSGGFNPPTAASFLSIVLQITCSSSANGRDAFAIDGVWLSSQNTSTFPNPIAATDTTAPFDTRGYTFKGTPNASETVLTFPGTLTDIYTVPAASSAVVSTVSVANMDINPTKIRIAVVPSGQTLAKKHWIALDAPLGAYSTQTFTIGMTLAAGDKIRVAADNSDTAFTAFGNES